MSYLAVIFGIITKFMGLFKSLMDYLNFNHARQAGIDAAQNDALKKMHANDIIAGAIDAKTNTLDDATVINELHKQFDRDR